MRRYRLDNVLIEVFMIVEIFDKEVRMFPWWKKFYFAHITLRETTTIKRINESLKPYGGKFVNNTPHGAHLVFDNEQDYVMFLLRWS